MKLFGVYLLSFVCYFPILFIESLFNQSYLIVSIAATSAIFLGCLEKDRNFKFFIFSKSLLFFFAFAFLQRFASFYFAHTTSFSLLLFLSPFFIMAYLFGAVPFGLLFSRLGNLPDPRTLGSGNIGATNVLRSGNKLIALTTLLADTLKGTLVFNIFDLKSADFNYVINFGNNDPFCPLLGLFAVLGHIFPIWLGFKGGKGVATALGVYAALFGYAGFSILLSMWLLTALIFRYSSLASLVAIYSAIPLGIYYNQNVFIIFLIALLVTFRHKDNLSRLYQGTENKISFAGTKP